MASFIRRLATASIMIVLVLGAVGAAFAQDGTPPPTPAPACVPDAQTACAKIVFYPATLKADLFLGAAEAAQPTAQVQQSTLWVTFASPAPGQTIDVVVKNIHDGGKDEGALYQYPDIPRTVTVPFAAGQTSTVTLSPVKQYIRGKIQAKCAPLNVLAGEDVSCAISIDGVAQTIPAVVPATPPTPLPDGSLPPAPQPTATLAAGQTTNLVVEPGTHEVKVDLVGANASLWPPMTMSKTVTVTAGNTPQIITATFSKAGRLVATLDKASEGWVGDFYVDSVMVATQVGSIDQWVKGNASHKVEVKNITHPLWPLIRLFADTTTTTYTTSGSTSTVTVKLATIPADQIATPFINPEHVIPASKYVVLRPGWLTTTQELAVDNMNHMMLRVIFNGQDLGDLRIFRTGITQGTDGYHIMWILSLGKLAPGAYSYTSYWSFDQVTFDGWDYYQVGTYWWNPVTFTVVP